VHKYVSPVEWRFDDAICHDALIDSAALIGSDVEVGDYDLGRIG